MFCAFPLGEIGDRASSQWQCPHVVAVVKQHFPVRREAANAVHRPLVVVVVFGVEEAAAAVDHRRLAVREVIGIDAPALQVERPFPVRRIPHRPREPALDQRALAGRQVHPIEVVPAAAPGDFTVVRRIVAADCPFQIFGGGDRGELVVHDLTDRARRNIEDRRLGGASRVGELHGLLRLGIVVSPVPHVDVGLRLGGFGLLGVLLLQADEQPRTVGAPARSSEFADDHPGWEAGRLCGIERPHLRLRRADLAPGEDDVFALRLAARLVATQHDEVGPLLAPRELIVIGGCGIERPLLAVGEVHHVGAVAEALLTAHRIRHLLPGIVERVGSDLSQVSLLAGRQAPHQQVGRRGVGVGASASSPGTAAPAPSCCRARRGGSAGRLRTHEQPVAVR